MIFRRLFQRRRLILVICTANICRSPVAAAMLRSELKTLGLEREFKVVSAGTKVGLAGQGPDPRMKKLARDAGVSLRGERTQRLEPEMIRRAQLIIVMERRHIEEVLAIEPAIAEGSIKRLGDWYGGDTHANGDIADPYFANRVALESSFEIIAESTSRLAKDLAVRSTNKGFGEP